MRQRSCNDAPEVLNDGLINGDAAEPLNGTNGGMVTLRLMVQMVQMVTRRSRLMVQMVQMVTRRSRLMVQMVEWWNGDAAEVLNGENAAVDDIHLQ